MSVTIDPILTIAEEGIAGGGVSGDVNLVSVAAASISLGQKPMGSSLPVVIASNQTAFPITFDGTQDVNVVSVGGSALALGQALAAASLPVVLASDQGAVEVTDEQAAGTWGYNAGTSGTVNLTGGKRVLQITAVALEAAATITINGGDTITLPYGSTDKVSSAITIVPRGNLTDPTIVFTGTEAYFVEYVT